MKKVLSRSERETIIRRASDEDEWYVFSEDPSVVTKMTKRWGPGKVDGRNKFGMFWKVPKKAISIRGPNGRKGRPGGFKKGTTQEPDKKGEPGGNSKPKTSLRNGPEPKTGKDPIPGGK